MEQKKEILFCENILLQSWERNVDIVRTFEEMLERKKYFHDNTLSFSRVVKYTSLGKEIVNLCEPIDLSHIPENSYFIITPIDEVDIKESFFKSWQFFSGPGSCKLELDAHCLSEAIKEAFEKQEYKYIRCCPVYHIRSQQDANVIQKVTDENNCVYVFREASKMAISDAKIRFKGTIMAERAEEFEKEGEEFIIYDDKYDFFYKIPQNSIFVAQDILFKWAH